MCINSIGNVYTTEAGMSNYVWTVSAGGTITAGGGAADNTVTVTWTTAGARSVSVNYTNGNGCTAAGPVVYNVTVGSSPATATLTGSGNACSGATSTIKSVITGGAPPYIINYTMNGAAQPAINPYASGTDFSLGILPVGTYNYQITSITDFCGNPVPAGGLPGVYTITIYTNPVANAGPAQGLCGTVSATLAAVPSVGTGTWTKVSGPGVVTFAPGINTPGATASVTQWGSYVFRWTEVNGGICTSSSDVSVKYERDAIAGPAQNLCGTLATNMAGNSPVLGTGTWTLVSGPGTVAFTPSANTPAATATVSAYGSYIFRWTIANGAFCTTSQVCNNHI